jgi:hypothetical protein
VKCSRRYRSIILRTVRDIETIDSELRSVAALRNAARERGGPLPSIAAADALLDERRELTRLGVAVGSGAQRRRLCVRK